MIIRLTSLSKMDATKRISGGRKLHNLPMIMNSGFSSIFSAASSPPFSSCS